MSKRIICDFDGCIVDNNVYPGFSLPKPGVKEVLQKLKDAGYYISIHSCRNSIEQTNNKRKAKEELEKYLKENNIPYDEIIDFDKPVATYYIDDRAIFFNGDWNNIIPEIEKRELAKNLK